MKLEFSGQIFEKPSNIKFRENLSSGSRVVPCGQTDEQTDTTKVIVGFRNFALKEIPDYCLGIRTKFDTLCLH
jgi:hypothetical protein